jgi:DNA-directed RNA polymerase subunit delta
MAENYKNQSMLNVAYGVLKDFNREMKFSELYTEVSLRLEFTDEKKFENISKFYTDLVLDGRFVALPENVWDLRENQKFEKYHIKMEDVYNEMDNDFKGNIDKTEYDDPDEIKGVTGDLDDVNEDEDEGDFKNEESDY